MSISRILSIVVLAIFLSAFALMAVDLVRGPKQHPKCMVNDYDCNLKNYEYDISRRPPSFSDAENLAITTPDAIRRNLEAAVGPDAYRSASMLRVIAAYPSDVRRRLCQNQRLMGRMSSYGKAIASDGERDEYGTLLGAVCQTAVR
jgi:hypothetical protein